METIEIWKTAIYDGVVYEGYEVSNLGRIKSLNYRRTGREEVMCPVEDKDGYLILVLRKNRKKKTCKVHRLVATVFLDNPDKKPFINHKDEVKTNNRVDNLEWIYHKDNCNHGTRNERVAKAQSKTVLQLTLSGHLIREWSSTAECGRNGFHQGAVAACCRGELKTHKGFRWMYK